ncbi:hypothetical protein NBRC116588_03110 [Pyruvatibacter sp. HU-CL02332]
MRPRGDQLNRQRDTGIDQLLSQNVDIHTPMNRVARLSVSKLKSQHLVRRQGIAASAKRNPRIGVLA